MLVIGEETEAPSWLKIERKPLKGIEKRPREKANSTQVLPTWTAHIGLFDSKVAQSVILIQPVSA